MNFSTWISIAMGIMVAIMAVLGGVLTSTKPWHRYAFFVLGCLIIVLGIGQAVLNDRDQRIRDAKSDSYQKTRDAESDALKQTILDMHGKMGVFMDLMQPPPALKPQPSLIGSGENIKDLTNLELCAKVIAFANTMRDFETNFKKAELQHDIIQKPVTGTAEEKQQQWRQQVNASMQRRQDYDNEFRKRFLGEAIVYRDDLLRRLKIASPKEEQNIIALQGALAGPAPISDLAAYLEKMARQLP
jgi:hypothetical protein